MSYWADDTEKLEELLEDRVLMNDLGLMTTEPPKGWQTVEEDGRTFLRHSGTGETKQMSSCYWCTSEKARAMHNERRAEARRVEARRVEAKHFYYTKGGCRIKMSSRVRHSKPVDWRTCDAMKNGRVCRKWQKLHQTEFNNRELPYRCQACRKANRDADPDFKPIGSDDE